MRLALSFFCLSAMSVGLALAQPQNLSVTPNAEKGLIRTFTFTLYHPNGAASISWAEIDLGPALASGSSCFFIIQPPYNDIVLMSNNSGTWNAPITPGSSATTSNSQCTITASGASITLSGNYLYVNVPVSFAPAYGPNATIWAISLDTSGQYSGGGSWSTLGSWTVGNPLHSVQVNPSSGSSAIGQQQIFTFTVSDDNGRGEIGAVQGIVGPQSSLNSCLFQVSPSGLVWLLSDQAVWMGPVTAGSAQTLQNSQCTISAQTLSVAQSSIVANGYDVRVPVTFNGYNGTVPIWLLTYDSFGGYAGWTQVGTRAVGSAPSFTLSAPPAQTLTAGQARNVQETIIPQNNFNSAVTFNWTNQGSWPAGLTASFSPSSATTSTMITISTMSTTPASTYTLMFSGTGGGITQTQSATVTVANAPPRPWSLGMTSNSGNSAIFNFTYQDDTGSLSITKAYFAVQNGALPPAPNACYGYYDQVANAFALLGDDGQWKISSWQMDGNRRYGGYDTQALVNSQCVLRAQASYVQRSGSLSGGAGYLTVNIQLDFRTAFGGSKNVYFSAVDYAGNNSGWVQPGNGLFSVQSTQFNSPATEQAIFSFLPFDHYDNTPASAIPLKSCPPGTTVRGCIQTALQNYSTQNVTGMKIAFGLCGGTFSTAISNCGGSNPQPNQAWLTNVGAFFADMRAYGQMTNVALSPIFNGIGDNGIQTNAQISDQFCTGQNKSVWLEPATPYPFDIGSDGGKGPPFTGGAARETYTCAPANPIFVGWPNIFSVIQSVLQSARSNGLTVNELEMPGELDFESSPLEARFVNDNMNGVEVYQGFRDMMSGQLFDPGVVTFPGYGNNSFQSGYTCNSAFGDEARVLPLSEYTAAIAGRDFGSIQSPDIVNGFICNGAVPSGDPWRVNLLKSWPQSTMIDVHAYPCIHYDNNQGYLAGRCKEKDLNFADGFNSVAQESTAFFNAIDGFLTNHTQNGDFPSRPTLMLGEGHSNNTFREASAPAQAFTCDGDGSPWYGAWAMINGYNLSGLASNGQQLINRPWAFQWGALPLDDQTSSPVYSTTLGCYAFPQVFDPPYNRHP